jgi:transcriptional regulator with XRE-family HTH domain
VGINKVIGAYIKQARLCKGKARRVVSKSIGVSQQQLQKYEIGENRISVEKLYQVSECLGVSIIDMIPPELKKELKGGGDDD